MLSLFTSRGLGAKIVPPNPREPKFPFPTEYKVPSSVMIILCSFPLLIYFSLFPSRARTTSSIGSISSPLYERKSSFSGWRAVNTFSDSKINPNLQFYSSKMKSFFDPPEIPMIFLPFDSSIIIRPPWDYSLAIIIYPYTGVQHFLGIYFYYNP